MGSVSKGCTKILVCVHKKSQFLEDEIYRPIHVGKALTDVDLGIPGDDTGEHISRKNREFCELTAHYWAWKNLSGVDFVGLAHYRRYLALGQRAAQLLWPVPFARLTAPKIDFSKELTQYDIILSNYDYHAVSNKIHYCYHHIVEDYDILRCVIQELYPDYLQTFDRQMIHRNRMSVGNMFVTRWAVFDDYSEWLFRILFEVEKRVKLSPYDHQRRVFGFLAERLLDVYCCYNKLRIKRVPIIFVSDDKKRSELHYLFKCLKKTFMFRFSPKSRV